jgi:putative FmdB family regulatory protein
MPAYDYRCTECDTVFEVVRAIGDTTQVVCPTCDAPAKRLFTPVGVVFKGSGFHNTDYRPKPKEDGASSTEKTPCSSAGSSPSCSSCPASE